MPVRKPIKSQKSHKPGKPLYKPTGKGFPLSEIMLLGATDAQLKEVSADSGTGLSLDEMKRVRDYFSRKGRNPTDVELQALGQAWSEHCCYKSSKLILKEHVFGIDTPEVIDRGDAGVMSFDEENAYALRIESHNHPSAVEPYGGAATGIGGIVRDVLCMGAQPIALVDPLFFGELTHPASKMPKGVKHPRYLLGGVVAGIRDYGNRIGIPTIAGSLNFDDSYLGNCLVNVGCIGIARKKDLYRNKAGGVGDILVLVGGRTGRDGIHGVTFASAVLSEKSEESSRGAVQLGDPITKEPVIHAVLEVAAKRLITGMKDLGGGGLSCVCGELAYAAGFGAEVDLEKVPLKEEGLAPWEIWVSESQERMMLAVEPGKLGAVLDIMRLFDIEATPIGKVVKEQVARVRYKGKKILEVDLEFLTGGPLYCRPCRISAPSKRVKKKIPKEPGDYDELLLKILADPNIACKDWAIRVYDHEVRGATVLKPLQGIIGHDTHGDAAVLKPVEDSWKGLAIATAANPWLASVDPYKGGLAIVDEVCRNLVAVGAKPHSLTNCLNFGNPEKPEVLGQFRETVRGMGEAAKTLGLPIPSGNVSFYNEADGTAVLPTAVVLGCGLEPDIRLCISSDFKREGDSIYLVGPATSAMGGSLFYNIAGGSSPEAPGVDFAILKRSIEGLLGAMGGGHVAACHDISHGGTAVALAEMCFGGQAGADVDLSKLPFKRADEAFFNEGNTRWLVEVIAGREARFESAMEGVPFAKVGLVAGKNVKLSFKKRTISIPLARAEKAWRSGIWTVMG
ncbi:MAG: phosphoribosylformylglycinamidine synthase subunit PurL [Methanobacteriota archaeon]